MHIYFGQFGLGDIFIILAFIALITWMSGRENKQFFRRQYGCKNWPHKCSLKSCKGWHRSHA